MNYPNTGQQPPVLYPPPKRPFPVAAVVMCCVGLFVALVVLIGVRGFRAIKTGSAEAIAVGNSFVDDMGRHDYGAARSLFTPSIQARTPMRNLKDIETLVEKHHGSFVSHGQPQWNIQNWNGQTSVRLVYPAQFTSTNSPISMTLIETRKGYRVYDAHYEF